MSKNFPDIAYDVSKDAAALREVIPEQMSGFSALGAAAYKDGALSARHKELIAIAIGITVRCDGCVAYHVRSAYQKGASGPIQTFASHSSTRPGKCLNHKDH